MAAAAVELRCLIKAQTKRVRGAQQKATSQAKSEQQPAGKKNKNSIMPMPHNVINLLTLSKEQTINVGILKNLERIFDRSVVAKIAHER